MLRFVDPLVHSLATLLEGHVLEQAGQIEWQVHGLVGVHQLRMLLLLLARSLYVLSEQVISVFVVV